MQEFERKSTTSQLEVDQQRRAILRALGEKSQGYFSNLKLWFSLKISKDEFDRRSRELLAPEQIPLHNKFLLSVITRCQSVCLPAQPDYRRPQMVDLKPKPQVLKQELSFKSFNPSGHLKEEQKLLLEVNSVKQKQKSVRDMRVVIPPSQVKKLRTGDVDYAPPVKRIKQDLVPFGTEKPKSLLCSNELKLPDVALLQGRILVHSFDMDLDGSDDQIVHVLSKAVHGFLKKILTAMSKRRHGFQLRHGRTVHSCGLDVPDPWLHNSWNLPYSSRAPVAVIDTGSDFVQAPALRPVHDAAEQSAAYEEACTSQTKRNYLPPATLFDLYETLQIYNNVIPSNTIYVLAMERISAKMADKPVKDKTT